MATQRWTSLLRRSFATLGTVLLVAMMCLGVATHAYAQGGAGSLIKKGQELFDDQSYEESIQTLSAALMRPGTAKSDKIAVYRLLAYNYIILKRTEEADGAVRGLLVLDPSYELPESESPRFRDFFKQVRAKWESEGKPGLEAEGAPAAGAGTVVMKHSSPAQVDAGEAVSLTGTLDDPKAIVSKVQLRYRAGSDGKFQSAKAKYAMHKFSAEIPADAVEPPLVEYYLVALDESGLPVAGRGDAESPLRIAVPEGATWYTSPWFWVPVSAAVVAGIVVTAVVLSTSSKQSTVTVNVFE